MRQTSQIHCSVPPSPPSIARALDPAPVHQGPCDAAAMTPQDEYISRSRLTITPFPTSSSSFCDTTLASSASVSTAPSSAGPSVAPSRRARSEPACLANDKLVVKSLIAHPYARLYSKKQNAGKHRKMWNHAFEKLIFTPQEISTMGAPTRRTIYTATLETHIDHLHDQLLGYSLAPVPPKKLEPYRGLNVKTCKSMISGLHHDAVEIKLKLLEIDRAIKDLQDTLNSQSKVQSHV